VPPLTNLLQIVGDLEYVYSSLNFCPHFRAIDDRGKTPLLIVDRELISTIVYQVLYPIPMEKESEDDMILIKDRLLETLSSILKNAKAGEVLHELLVYIAPKDGVIKMIGNDPFDNYDQPKLQRLYENTFNALGGAESLSGFSPAIIDEICCISSRYQNLLKLTAFSKPTPQMASDVIEYLPLK
jgi:hypothetical protein